MTNIVTIIKKSIKDLNGYWLVVLIPSLLVGLLPTAIQFNKVIGLLLVLLFTGAFKTGLSKICLSLIRKQPVELLDVIYGFKIFKNSLGVFLLSLVFIVLGMFLFIIPGIIIMIWLSQSFFILVENPTLEPLEVFKKSRELIRGKELDYFVLILFFTLITLTLVYTKLFVIGLFVGPIQYVVFANFYSNLKNR